MNKYLHSATKALFDSDLVASRLIIALAEWFWFALLLWPGDCYTLAHAMFAEVQAGARPMPATAEEALALLPPMVWPT